MEEKVCVLCQRVDADPGICGRKLEMKDICAHEYCTIFADELQTRKVEEEKIILLLFLRIKIAVLMAENKECFVCHQRGASITCWQTGCGRSFHLPCATQGECVTQYFGEYRSFCEEHRPQQAVEAASEKMTMCLLCSDLVDETKSYRTMVCPACQHAWFHRECIQGYALSAGTSCFRCPLCRDTDGFKEEMLRMGIRIPSRRPRWEEVEAFPELGQRHGQCDASQCLCPGGREQDNEGPWELLLCCSCAAEGTHRRCSHLAPGTDNWECQGCAGSSTNASASSEIYEANTSSESALGPSHDSPSLEGCSCTSPPVPVQGGVHSFLQGHSQSPNESPGRRQENSQEPAAAADTSTHDQAAPEPSHHSQAPSTSSQLPSGASSSSPELNSSRRSSRPRPMRVRVHSRLQRRSQSPYHRPRRNQENSREPAAAADTSTHGHAVPEPSHPSQAPRTRSRLPSGASSSSPALDSSRRSSRPWLLRL